VAPATQGATPLGFNPEISYPPAMRPGRLRPLRLLLATPLTILAVACSREVTSNECEAALERCGSLDFGAFCHAHLASCSAEGQPILDPAVIGGLYLPANQTVTVDLSQAGLDAGVVDLNFYQADDFSDPDGYFQFEMDGVSAWPMDELRENYTFPGHVGPPKELKATWYGTARPKVRVQMSLGNTACLKAAWETGPCKDVPPSDA
jgi:hypothetical protein